MSGMLNRKQRVVHVAMFLLAMLLLPVLGYSKKKPPMHPVNLNSASALELQQVPGIGPSTADKILQMRKSYGAFKSVDDLLAIKGIGPKKLDKMKKYLTVGKAPQSKKPATAAQAASAQGKAPPGKDAKAAPVQKPVPPTVSESEEP